ncbi:MAG: MdtA/MuxA family multidrug efflux RND transporter periplasmic adaptor subunit [Actinomycetota bacterium]|nr:MdtA/MuxA family multidrug efflux RND transporter periplasmic adaptor subunit [Actinomycetota bacterium]
MNDMTDTPRTPTERLGQNRAPGERPSAPSSITPAAALAQSRKITPPRRRWLWLFVPLLLGLCAYFLSPKVAGVKSADGAPKAVPAPLPVVAATAHTGDIGVFYTGLGTVTPLATVTVRSRVDGQIMSIRYREGDTVHKGDLLVGIDDGPYRAALTQAEGQLIRDQATLENARIDLARYQQLVPLKAVPEQQLATQQATVHQSEGVVKVDQGQIASAKVTLAYTRITAPVSGRAGLRLVDVGNIVHAADTNGLLVITQMDPISVIFTISEDQLQVVLAKVTAGQKLEVDAFDRAGNTKLAQGSLSTLDNEVDPTTGTLKLRATFDNAKGTLFPNQFVNARLLVQEKRGVTLVPTAAVQRNSQATYVYLVKADSTVTVRSITLGTTEGNDSEVTSGLAAGDVVVMTGVDRLQEGSRVNANVTNTPVGPSVSPPVRSAPRQSR